MSEYMSIARPGGGVMLYAYEHTQPSAAAMREAASKVVAAHETQSARRMCYTGDGMRFLCSSEPGYTLCTICSSSMAQEACEKLQQDTIDAFNAHVAKQLGSSDASAFAGVTKTFQFVGFDREYRTLRRATASNDGESGSAARRVTQRLHDVEGFMRKNVTDLLGRGVALDAVEAESSRLVDASKHLHAKSRQARIWAQLQQYLPVAVVGLIILLVACFWFFF